MDAGPHLDRPMGLIYIEGFELAQKFRRVSPGLDPHLSHDAVDVGDLAHFQILCRHGIASVAENFISQAAESRQENGKKTKAQEKPAPLF